MLKRTGRFLEARGHYLLAAVCVLVILLSGLSARAGRERERADAQALSDTAQRLADVTDAPEGFLPLRPCGGEVIRGYSEAPVFFPGLGLWQAHPAVDFAAPPGERILAAGDGRVESAGETLRIDHGNGYATEYRGLETIAVREGQRVRAGQEIGTAGDGVPFEGDGHVCVRLLYQDCPVPFLAEQLTKR